MMRRQLDDMHSNNEAMAVLYSSEGAIYGRYGYGPASFAANYLMDKRLCRLKDSIATVPGGGDGSVRLIGATRPWRPSHSCSRPMCRPVSASWRGPKANGSRCSAT